MSRKANFHPLVVNYFLHIKNNLPTGAKLELHSEYSLDRETVTIWHTHGNFTVDISEIIRIERENKINGLLNDNTQKSQEN